MSKPEQIADLLAHAIELNPSTDRDQKVVDFDPPYTLLEKVREAWFWRQHKRRIAAGIRKHFRPIDRWESWPRFPRPITSILYERGKIVAYKDGEAKWWDFSD